MFYWFFVGYIYDKGWFCDGLLFGDEPLLVYSFISLFQNRICSMCL